MNDWNTSNKVNIIFQGHCSSLCVEYWGNPDDFTMFLGSVPASICDIVCVYVRVSMCGQQIFFCLNDQAYNCLIHLQSLSVYSTCVYAAQTVHTGIEQVCWHECRHCSWLLSGDDWQVRVGIAVSRLQALDLLKETNNGRMSWAIPHSGLRWNEIIFFYSLGPWIFKD